MIRILRIRRAHSIDRAHNVLTLGTDVKRLEFEKPAFLIAK